MKLSSVFFASTLLVLSPQASAENCDGLMQITAKIDKMDKSLAGFVSHFRDANPPCGSLKAVLLQIFNPEKPAGRKLEPDKPLDLRAAQANLDLAFKNPEIKAQMDKARREITDENVRLAFEAAILDDEGFYSARDLKIQQLLPRLH
jgi:hypothetical protein